MYFPFSSLEYFFSTGIGETAKEEKENGTKGLVPSYAHIPN